jgi:hypothetical protein
LKSRKHDFYPKSFDEDKKNYQRFFLISENGVITESIMLRLPTERIREEVICLHYLKFLAKKKSQEGFGFNIISRDNPWDFEIQMSTGEKTFIEITSIADNQCQFVKMKLEATIEEFTNQDVVRFRTLRKLGNYFLQDDAFRPLIDGDYRKNDYVLNPFFGRIPKLYLSRAGDLTQNLKDHLVGAINKKVLKKHLNKENTILLIDNRSISFGIKDFERACEVLKDYFRDLPFKEVWIYVGYCSDLNGNNAEYSLISLK